MDKEDQALIFFSDLQLWFQSKLDPNLLPSFLLKDAHSLSQILKAPSVEMNEDTQYSWKIVDFHF